MCGSDGVTYTNECNLQVTSCRQQRLIVVVARRPCGLFVTFAHLLPPPRRRCFPRCLSVCPLATLRKNLQTDLREIFREDWQRVNEQMVKFRCLSRTDSPDGVTDIATLVRRALAEVCTVPVLLVIDRFSWQRIQEPSRYGVRCDTSVYCIEAACSPRVN